jgi:hypothetical protein
MRKGYKQNSEDSDDTTQLKMRLGDVATRLKPHQLRVLQKEIALLAQVLICLARDQTGEEQSEQQLTVLPTGGNVQSTITKISK